MPMMFPIQTKMFQSTYLYKVRQKFDFDLKTEILFQSTYLYKVRLLDGFIALRLLGFNPRTYIRYDIFSNASICFFKVSIHVPI